MSDMRAAARWLDGRVPYTATSRYKYCAELKLKLALTLTLTLTPY